MNDLLDNFIDTKGFNLESYDSYLNDLDFYLYKEIKNGYLVVIFSKEGEELSQIESFKNHALKNNINFYLINIIMANQGYRFNDYGLNNYSEIILFENGEAIFQDEIGENIFADKVKKKAKKLSLKERLKTMPITSSIIVINILIYLLTAFFSRSFNIDIWVLIFFGAKVNELISQGQVYRLITSAFLHGNLIHVFFNMYALFNIGGLIEKVLGKKSFLIIYFFSAFTSSFLSYSFNPSVSVGASGAIFGLLGALVVLSLLGNENINKGLLYNILMIIGINLVIGFAGRNIIDNFGHIGGLIGGLLSTWPLVRLAKRKKNL